MANKRISELDEAAKLQDKDLLVIVQDSMTKKITILNAKELLKGKDGINGKDGKDGAPGPVNTITIGTVTKGEEASATLTGTPPNQVLNLVLPKGENGEQGETGEKGAQGEPGVPGKDGEDGINGISILSVEVGNIFQEDNYTITQLIINKSDGSQEVVNVKSKNGVDGQQGPEGPKGDKGDKGEAGQVGEPGPANKLEIGTVQSGNEANAEIIGDSPNQKINLVLPKGDKGDKGDKGEVGPKGDKGETGPQGEKGDTGVTGLQGPKGDKGDKGDNGKDGTSVLCIKVNNEEEAIQHSATNPNNIYYW